MKVSAVIAMAALLCATYVRADSLDDAEAKKRGVPVSQIQLEHAQTKIAELEKQVAALRQQNKDLETQAKALADAAAKKIELAEGEAKRAVTDLASLKAAMTPAQKKAAEKAKADEDSLRKRVAEAIAKHEIIVGMTQAEATQSAGNEGYLRSDDGTSKTYEFSMPGSVQAGTTKVIATMVNGKVTSCQNVDEPYRPARNLPTRH